MLTERELFAKDRFLAHINKRLAEPNNVFVYVFLNQEGKVVTLPYTNSKFYWRRKCDAMNALNQEIRRMGYPISFSEVTRIRENLLKEKILMYLPK